MPLRAMAFHEAISVARLEELFYVDTNAVFACSIAARCPTCKTRFAVFFPAKDDEKNPEYLAGVLEAIGRDCKRGHHVGEYSFSTTP